MGPNQVQEKQVILVLATELSFKPMILACARLMLRLFLSDGILDRFPLGQQYFPVHGSWRRLPSICREYHNHRSYVNLDLECPDLRGIKNVVDRAALHAVDEIKMLVLQLNPLQI